MPYSRRLFIIVFLLLSLIRLDIVAGNFIGIHQLRKDRYARFNSFDFEGIQDIGAVSGFAQDRNGYIWMAGAKGLGRFDGYRLKVYKADRATGGLPSGIINKIKLDPQGNLWVASAGGLSRYSAEEDQFETIFGKHPSDESESGFFAVRAFLFQGDSLIWLATQAHALMRLNRKDLSTEIVVEDFAIDQPYYRYHHLEYINDQLLIFGGRSRGPYIYDIQADTLIHLPVDSQINAGKKAEYDVSILQRKSENAFWIGGLEGLYLYDLNENYFEKVFQGTVYDLMQDRNDNFWLGTGNGLIKFNLENEEAILYQKNKDNPQSLGGIRIFAVFQERGGRIWIGHNKGVSTYNALPNGIQYLFHIPGDAKTPASSSVSALAKAENQSFWIGTTDAGLILYDLASDQLRHYSLENNAAILSNNIRCLKQDAAEKLYIGYWAGRGFGVYENQRDGFSNYTFNKSSLHDDWYNDFAFTEDHKVWLGFWGGPGLTLFNPVDKTFDNSAAQYLHDAYLARRIQTLHVDSRNRLWIGTTQSGIQRLDPQSKKAISYFTGIHQTGGGFDELGVFAIAEFSNGDIYASSGTALYSFDEANNRFQKIELHEKDASLEIFRMLPHHEHLWLLTSKGLMRYQTSNNWISDYSMLVKLNFTQENAAIIALDDGRLVVGGNDGLAILQPEKMGLDHNLPAIFFSQFQILGNELIHMTASTEKIELRWDENFFSIYFGSNKWDKTDQFSYLHQLEGFDRTWVNLNNKGMVQYTNVPPGRYRFKMKASDRNGMLFGNEISFEIIIVPPWWQSWWFKSLLVIIIIAIIVALWQLRVHELKQKLHNISLNQKLLRLQMNPHFIFNSLSSIQAYIYSNEQHLAGQYLSDFARLIRLILENNRHELISLDREIETISLYMTLQQLRFENKFDFTVFLDPALDAESCYVPPMLTQPFLENAVEHGIKTISNRGKIDLTYDYSPPYIKVKIMDNGIGLTASGKRKQPKAAQHESLSLKICRDRLALIEKKSGIQIAFEVKEMLQHGKVLGTLVQFDIPANLKKTDQNE